MPTKPLFFLLTVSFSAIAAADQAAYITREQAEEAAARIAVGSEIRHFAPPAGDTQWRAERVVEKTVAHTGFENYYEVRINGTGIDLAYVYIPEGDRWVNLAMALGLEVSEVPHYLGEQPLSETKPARSHWKGVIGDDLGIHLDLSRDAQQLYGAYEYLSKGLPLELKGDIEDDGAFTLSEYADDKKTGVFVGKLDDSSGRMQGTWTNADGSRSLPFKADRFARSETITWHATAGQVTIEGEAAYPVFQLENAAAKVLNDLFAKDLTSRYDVFEEDAREVAIDFPANADPPTFEFNATDYSIEGFSPSRVSVVYEIYTYTGGAHPNHMFRVFNLSIGPDGAVQRIDLPDLFKKDSDYAADLSNRIISDLRRQEAQWVLDGELKELKPEELSAFAITSTGLRFFFDPYAVGPYAQGPFIVDIPYTEIGTVSIFR